MCTCLCVWVCVYNISKVSYTSAHNDPKHFTIIQKSIWFFYVSIHIYWWKWVYFDSMGPFEKLKNGHQLNITDCERAVLVILVYGLNSTS